MHVRLGCLILLALATTGCSKKQEIVFEAESIHYKNKDSSWKWEITQECTALSKEITVYLNDGWKVVASSPKEKVVYKNKGSCVGTEYVVEK